MEVSVSEMNDNDLEQIRDWEFAYGKTAEFNDINRYILNSFPNMSLYKLVKSLRDQETNVFEEERVFAAKNKDDKLLCFIACILRPDKGFGNSVHLSYIVTNPEFKHQGTATKLLESLFVNSEKHFGFLPEYYTGVIEPTNTNSVNLFKKFGFKSNNTLPFYKATTEIILQKIAKYSNEKQSQQKNQSQPGD